MTIIFRHLPGSFSQVLYETSDPENRKYPIHHILKYEAITKAQNDNFGYFDFFGYNNFADEKDQVYNINQVKKGFGENCTFLAKKINVSIIPYGFALYRRLLEL